MFIFFHWLLSRTLVWLLADATVYLPSTKKIISNEKYFTRIQLVEDVVLKQKVVEYGFRRLGKWQVGWKKLQNYDWKRSTFRSSSIWTRLELTSVLHFFWIYRLKMRVRSGMDIILYCNAIMRFFFTKMAMKVELSTWECQSANWRERWERKQTREKAAPSKRESFTWKFY